VQKLGEKIVNVILWLFKSPKSTRWIGQRFKSQYWRSWSLNHSVFSCFQSAYREQKLVCFVRIEFGDGVLGESAKVEVNGKEDDFSFSATFDCGGNLDQWAIDEQTYRPMISKSLNIENPQFISCAMAMQGHAKTVR